MIESGNAATLVSAYGNQQRANEDRGNIMSNALKDVGGAIQGARKKMDERTANEHLKVYIKSLGGNPEAVDGGLEATKAEILRLHQQTDEASKEKARTVAMAHDVTMQQMSDTAATGRQAAGFANETSQRQGATAEQTAMQRATQTELGGEVGELTAPAQDGAFTGMLGQLPPGQAPIPMTRDANEQDVIDRNAAAPGKYRLDSMTAARKALAPDVKPVDPSLVDARAAQAERDRAAAAKDSRPPETPEEKEARIERESGARARGTASVKPKPLSIEAQVAREEALAAARARGSAAGKPPESNIIKALKARITDIGDLAKFEAAQKSLGVSLGTTPEQYATLVEAMATKYPAKMPFGGSAAPADVPDESAPADDAPANEPTQADHDKAARMGAVWNPATRAFEPKPK